MELNKMKIFGLVLIGLTSAASPYYYRRSPRDLTASANGASFGPGSNNKVSLSEGFTGKAEKQSKKADKKANKESKKAGKAAKESGGGNDDGEKKKQKKKKIDCEDEAIVAKYIEELLAPNETHDDISNYVKCKKTNKKKELKEHKKYKNNHKKEQKKLKQQDKKKYNEQFYGLISQESSRTEGEPVVQSE